MRAAGALACALGTGASRAQTPPSYPVRPVTLVVPAAAGTPVDALARLAAAQLSERLRQPFNVDNRPGNDPLAAALDVLKEPADGYTLLFATSTTLGLGAALSTPPRLDPGKDFLPVSLVATVDYLFVSTPAYASRTAPTPIGAMKAAPGKVRFASGGKSDPATLVVRAFAAQAGIQFQDVTFKDAQDARAGLLSGKADVMFLDASEALPLAAEGRIAILGTAASRSFPGRPEILPLARTGFDWRLWIGLVARTGTPNPAVWTVAVEMREIAATESFREAVAKLGMESIVVQKPEHFGAVLLRQQAAWVDLVKKFARP